MFPSALDAVSCALAIQARLADEPELKLHIDIHSGDIVVQADEVSGDGVNIASRICSLSEGGGLCVSGEIYRSIRNQPDIEAVSLGERRLKNVGQPVAVYLLGRPGMVERRRPRIPRPSSPLRYGAVGLVLVALAAATWWARERSLTGPEPIHSIAVLPLENLSGDPGQEYFADGMTEALNSELGKVASLHFISRTSVMQYKRAREPLPEIAGKLGVDAVVEGSVLRAGDRVRITAQLIDARADRHLWAESYDQDLQDVLALQSEVARAVAREVRGKLTPQDELRLSSSRSVDPETHAAYLKGHCYWNKRTKQGTQKAIEHFKRAIDTDPGYAPAYAGLADAYISRAHYGWAPPREVMPKAEAAATRALEIDESLAEAHTALGGVIHFYHWNWSEAERRYRCAIELNSSHATAHQWLAGMLIPLGRSDEGLAEIKRAQELDPLSSIINMNVAYHTYVVRDYERAVELSMKALEIDPRFATPHQTLALAHLQRSMPQQAIAEAEEFVSLLGSDARAISILGYVYARAGRRDETLRIMEELIHRSEKEYVPPLSMAWLHNGLGDTERALASLQEAYEERSGELIYIGTDPVWDPLRSDPRFQVLLRRMGFPQG